MNILGVANTSKLLSKHLIEHILNCKLCTLDVRCKVFKQGFRILKYFKKERG